MLTTILPSIIGGVSQLATSISQDCNRVCGFKHPFNEFRRQDCREACDITATKEAQAAAVVQQYSIENAQAQAGLVSGKNAQYITLAAIGIAAYFIIKKVK